jgi:hypothetical protein
MPGLDGIGGGLRPVEQIVGGLDVVGRVEELRDRCAGPVGHGFGDGLDALGAATVVRLGPGEATVEKRREKGRVVEIVTRVVLGTPAAIEAVPAGSKVSRRINTSILERQNATDRHRNARKARKTYMFSKDWRVHEAMTHFTMYSYNFCWPIRTLAGRDGHGSIREQTPAMAAGLADHVWTMREWVTMPAIQLC